MLRLEKREQCRSLDEKTYNEKNEENTHWNFDILNKNYKRKVYSKEISDILIWKNDVNQGIYMYVVKILYSDEKYKWRQKYTMKLMLWRKNSVKWGTYMKNDDYNWEIITSRNMEKN